MKKRLEKYWTKFLSEARKIKTKLITEIDNQNLSDQIKVFETGSISSINQGVIVGVYPTGEMYRNMTEQDIEEFIEERFIKGRPYEKLLISENTRRSY
jgi:(2Fe-2S) ferredoxin